MSQSSRLGDLKMENINATILKTKIEAIPILTKENFSSWRTCIALFKLGGLKDQMINGQPELEEDGNTILCAIILSKLSTQTQNNVVNSENEDNTQVYNQFSNIEFEIDIGIKMEEDIITYDLLKRLPSSLENIKQRITHSPDAANIKPETLLDHLEIHLNELKVSNAGKGESITTTMYTNDDQRCSSGTHNPNLKTHTKYKCWAIYPEKLFILDSGSSYHMVSNCQLFTNLDKGESGLINTSCGLSTLQIKGKGSIKTKFKDCIVVLHNVLSLPDITFNVISLRHLLLEQCHINFHINHFTIIKNDKPFLDRHNENNLPILKLEPLSLHSTHLSSAEILHKSLGHVSFCRLRCKVGIQIKSSETCKSCAVVKITKASFKHQTSMAETPFEELHLDLIGPISRLVHKLQKYILTIVDVHS
ncbi:hypothetical protein VP01_3033g1 [Puccinia sorghi]|uniref:Retrovirus-related Pol polyprotein from transposon TNT 1-94-like beta-barrel domain-containing protein n=1 Tax=Puccinia sorghi TaxID=27349 RepID=A0A0L6V1V0_9BASI|nr:hypothetical protein VP01_3033g1 [Puccinia sorghi]